MKATPTVLAGIVLTLSTAAGSLGQGCSDAGFCTINSLQPGTHDSAETFHQIRVGASFGKADHAVSVFGSDIEYYRRLHQNLALEIKLTTLAQTGNGISVFGLSDIFLSANIKTKRNFDFTIGVKIPLSDGNTFHDELPLPMDYQSSLGTLDLIAGMGYTMNKLQLIAAIQYPLTQNENRFLASYYPADSPLRDFQSTNMFERSGDVLLRISYPVSISHRVTFTPGLLPIYHLADDRFTDEMTMKNDITGSQGLTLNANVYLDLAIHEKSKIQFILGAPLVVRDARPDGLTRSLVVNLNYAIRF